MLSNKKVFMNWLYDELYEALLASGERFVRSSYPNRDDIIHDAIVAVFQTADEHYESDNLESHPNIKGWVYKVFYNRLRKELKKSISYYDRSRFYFGEDMARIKQVEIFDKWLENEEYRQVLQQLKEIARTPLDHVVFHEYFVESKSAKQIANKLNTTEGKVKGIIYRMRKRAKKRKYLLMTIFLFAILTIKYWMI